MRCPTCGQENPAGFRFCGSCGLPLAAPAAEREARKIVTAVFCDLTGSTALGDGADPEALRATMRGYYEQLRTILERHGGTVEKFIGDAVMAVFGVPVAHEDDALRAVRAAWEMREAVIGLGLLARIGVNTGEVMAGEGDTLVTGDAVNVAARLEQATAPGDVLIGAETAWLVRDAVRTEPVEVAARGKPEPLQAFRLTALDPQAAAVSRRMDTPLIGRRSELEQLEAAFQRSVRERRCNLFTVLGQAGVGKSRLVAEFVSGVDAIVLHGRCLHYGEGITYWPVVSALKQLGPRAEQTLARLVAGAATANELFWMVRAQLEQVAAERPLVVWFDDVHWGESTFLDLIDHIADLSRDAPLLVVCSARPELVDRRAGWGGGKMNATTILLEPLTAAECAQLIVIHGDVAAGMRERIISAAEGNPLFVEEMVALAREAGDVRVPGTVRALLQARLDQLETEERTLIQHGSVEGQVFHQGALAELTRSAELEPRLTGLVRKELIRPAAASFAGDHAFRFRHLLIRDTAYDALPKQTRAELHERFAGWLEHHRDELIEYEEVCGYHLEQAAGYLRELGRPDRQLERRAGRALAAAGLGAAARRDAAGALNLLGRAVALLPEDDERRGAALLEQLLMFESAGRPDEQLAVIDRLEASGSERLRMHGRIARVAYLLHSDPQQAVDGARRAVAEALPVFTAVDDQLGLAHAHHLSAWTSWIESRAEQTVAAIDHVVEHATRCGATGLVVSAALMSSGALRYGPFTEAQVRRRLEVIDRLDSATARYAILVVEAHLACRAGRFGEAIDLGNQATSIAENLGLALPAILARWEVADILHVAGRLDEAATEFREVIDWLQAHGRSSFCSTAFMEFAAVAYDQGDTPGAARLVAEGAALGGADDVVNFALSGRLGARFASDRGDHEAAQRLAREGLEYAYRTDFPEMHAAGHAALAWVLMAAGRCDEAGTEARLALELWDRYGYTVEAERVRAQLAQG